MHVNNLFIHIVVVNRIQKNIWYSTMLKVINILKIIIPNSEDDSEEKGH